MPTSKQFLKKNDPKQPKIKLFFKPPNNNVNFLAATPPSTLSTAKENEEDLVLTDDEEKPISATQWKRLRKHKHNLDEPSTQTQINALDDSSAEEEQPVSSPAAPQSASENDSDIDEEDLDLLLDIGNNDNIKDDKLEIDSDDNDNDTPSHPVPRKRLRKHGDFQAKKINKKTPIFNLAQLRSADEFLSGKYSFSKANITVKDDSDSEDAPINPRPYLEKFPEFPKSCVEIGVYLKLLANVYLRKIDKTANIFLPYYIMETATESNTNGIKHKDFFRTPKGEICVFASGGLYNVWEKTVAHVLKAFLKGEKVKVIRATWTQKHLYKDKKIQRDIEEEFKGKETELHSEYYFDIYFRHFFLPTLPKLTNLTIYAYSWWDVCNDCADLLIEHENLLGPDTTLSYKIAASRRYEHDYSSHSIIENAYVPTINEANAWKKIWASVLEYVRKDFKNGKEKKIFWTKTKEGLEICKWLGQAFVENKIASGGTRSDIALKKGDVLKFYAEADENEVKELENLLSYLEEKNWELSCWYKPPYQDTIQLRWKRHWRQHVMPHFGWEIVFESEDCDTGADCEMCGYPNIHNVSLVFNPKFRVSNTFFNQPQKDQAMKISNKERNANFNQLPSPLKQKRKQSLSVGSECVKVLLFKRTDVEEMQSKRTKEERNAKWEELDQREADNEALEKAEREISKRSMRNRAYRRK